MEQAGGYLDMRFIMTPDLIHYVVGHVKGCPRVYYSFNSKPSNIDKPFQHLEIFKVQSDLLLYKMFDFVTKRAPIYSNGV